MLQIVDGHEVYVVEFEEMPELPITWDPNKPEERPYALVLARAISDKVITEPGKYGLSIEDPTADVLNWDIFKIIE